MIAHYNGMNVDELYLCDLQIHRSTDLHFSQRPDAIGFHDSTLSSTLFFRRSIENVING